MILKSQAGGGKQGEKNKKGIVGHCFGSEVSVWLAEVITRKKVGEQRKYRTNDTDEMETKKKRKMVRREKRENEERKEGWDARMSNDFRKIVTKMSASCSPVRSPVQKGRGMILTDRHILCSCPLCPCYHIPLTLLFFLILTDDSSPLDYAFNII